MSEKSENFRYEFLNGHVHPRTHLQRRYPFIRRLEDYEGFKFIRLCGVEVPMDTKGEINLVKYEAVAGREKYPDVAEHLVSEGVLKERDIEESSVVNQDRNDEYENILIVLDEGNFRFHLNVYHPNHFLKRH